MSSREEGRRRGGGGGRAYSARGVLLPQPHPFRREIVCNRTQKPVNKQCLVPIYFCVEKDA